MESEQATIYTGIWTDWSHGSILGKRLRLSASHAQLLTAFIVLFITWVGVEAWTLAAFAIHQAGVPSRHCDILRAQQQVIIRNTDSSASATLALIQHAWAWPWTGGLRLSAWRSVYLCVSAVLLMLFFQGMATIVSLLLITTSGDLRLIAGSNCGYLNYSGLGINDFDVEMLNDTRSAAECVRSCYYRGNRLSQCTTYVTERLPRKANTAVPCPFNTAVCLPEVSAHRMASGYLSSMQHFGINFPENESVEYRKVSKCALHNQAGYTTNDSASMRYFYGNPPGRTTDFSFEQFHVLTTYQAQGIG